MRRTGLDRIKRYSCKTLVLVVFAIMGGGLAHPQVASANASVALSQPLTVRWRYDSNLTLNLTPAFDAERIYLPLAGGLLVSLKATDGQLYWRAELGGELSASPVADNHSVYVASVIESAAGVGGGDTGTLRALGREGGVTQWMRTLPAPLRGALTLVGNRLFGGSDDGRFYAINKETGETIWSVATGARFHGQPVVVKDRVYAGSDDGTLFAIDEASGRIVWRYRTRGPVRGPVAIAHGSVYFGSGDGYVYAVNSASGQRLWRKRTGAGVQAVTRVNDSILVASLDNFVYLFSLSGSRVWKRQLPGRISAQPLTAADGALFTPISSPAGVVLGLKDGRPVNSLPTGGEITSSAAPIAVGDAVLVTTGHGLLAFAQPNPAPAK